MLTSAITELQARSVVDCITLCCTEQMARAGDEEMEIRLVSCHVAEKRTMDNHWVQLYKKWRTLSPHICQWSEPL